jgi:hypothetical protein
MKGREFRVEDDSSSDDVEDEGIIGDEGSISGNLCVPEIEAQAELLHPANMPPRDGKFYRGLIIAFDSQAQAHHIVFLDGTKGWYQLWRPDEHFELLANE